MADRLKDCAFWYVFVGVLWVGLTTFSGHMRIKPETGVPYWAASCAVVAVWPYVVAGLVVDAVRQGVAR